MYFLHSLRRSGNTQQTKKNFHMKISAGADTTNAQQI